MPSFKLGRTTEDIHRELSAILREVKDPRVKDCLLSVVRAEVTNDLSYCTVYVLSLIHISSWRRRSKRRGKRPKNRQPPRGLWTNRAGPSS